MRADAVVAALETTHVIARDRGYARADARSSRPRKRIYTRDCSRRRTRGAGIVCSCKPALAHVLAHAGRCWAVPRTPTTFADSPRPSTATEPYVSMVGFRREPQVTGCCEAGELRPTDRARYQEQTCAGAGGTSKRTDSANGSPDACHGDVLANEGEWRARRAYDVPARAMRTYNWALERAHEVQARATRTYQRTGTGVRTRTKSLHVL